MLNLIIKKRLNIDELNNNTAYLKCYIFDNNKKDKIYIYNVKIINNYLINSWILNKGDLYTYNNKLLNSFQR